eukprot:scaffold211309_cov59-Attheya_sp.AAC.3
MADFGAMLNQLKRDADNAVSVRHQEVDEREVKRQKRRDEDASGDLPPVRTIYCVCPPNLQTGGPEAMHQLCHMINHLSNDDDGVNAVMLYLTEDRSRLGGGVQHARHAKPVAAYRRYRTPLALHLPTQRNELVVWPEIWTHLMDSLPGQQAIWWLSVDNNKGRFQDWKKLNIWHLHQSDYARTFLEKQGAKRVVPMTEFIPPFSDSQQVDRDVQVLYNPAKGMHFTDELIKRAPSIQFLPIGAGEKQLRISPEKVTALLHRAKVYIDFGPHPGMDRLPREAAMAHCIVVTNRMGAAGHDTDVPLFPKYKFGTFDVDAIYQFLRSCLDDYETHTKDLDPYRKWIDGQEDRMKECVSHFLTLIVDQRKQPSPQESTLKKR